MENTTNTTAPIAADFKGHGAIFNVKKAVDNGPAMDGHIKPEGAGEDVKGVRIAAFAKTGKESGRPFYSLAIGEKGARVYGALFPNGKKEKDGQPDYTGSIDLADGVKLYVSGWKKTGEKAGDYISLAVEPARAAAPEADSGEQQAAA